MSLGANTQGQPIRALMVDQNYLTTVEGVGWGVFTRANHRRKMVNVLWSDGSVSALNNASDQYTVDARKDVYQSFQLILNVFENADKQ